MRVNIVFKFQQGPWGGGNQFLQALRKSWQKQGSYAESVTDADIILFNSHHCLEEVLRIKRRYPNKTFIHRLDGIMSLTRNDPGLDRQIFAFNRLAADGTIFQSDWAREQAERIRGGKFEPFDVIENAPDPALFFTFEREPRTTLKILASSWSANPKKGFRFLRYLDENLDQRRFQMTFVGNCPFGLSRIKYLAAQAPAQYAKTLRDHDIYVFSGEDEACSNSIVEALHCGVPVVFLRSGSNAQIVDKAGEGFGSEVDLLLAIDKVAQNYKDYVSQCKPASLSQVQRRYLNFLERVHAANAKRLAEPRRLDYRRCVCWRTEKLIYALKRKLPKIRS